MDQGVGMSSLVRLKGLDVLPLVFAFVFLTPARTFGQAASAGTVSGLVTDPTGSAVVGAAITLTDKATGTPHATVTNEAGRYVFVNVTPGSYDITATRSGFRIAKAPDIAVSVGTSVTLDLKLELGSVSETVEVTTTGVELQTTNATMGSTISGDSVLLLPNLGRDASTLAVLQPGVTPDGFSSGANFDQNLYQLDGGNNTNDMDGNMTIYTPSFSSGGSGSYGTVTVTGTPGAGPPTGVLPTPVESVEEFKVSTAGQTADFNGAAGAQVQLVTKRGTNQWHGAAYEYYLGSNFGANNWDNNSSDTPKANTHQNRFGASGGGPVLPNLLGGKTYFFANYEGHRYPLSQTITRTVPTASFREGIVQVRDANGNPLQFNFNPANGPTALCGAANNLPCDPRGLWMNPMISQVFALDPLPNAAGGDGLNTGLFRANLALPWSDNFGVARLDHDFGQKWHFMSSYRYYHLTRATNNQVDIGGLLAGDKLGVPASASNRPQVPWYLVAAMTTNITQNLTNDFHYNFLRNFWSWSTAGAPPQIADFTAGAIEIGGESTNALLPMNVNTQQVRQRFWDGKDNVFRDDVSYIRGNHLFQLGGSFQRNFDYHQRDDNGSGVFNEPVFQVTNGSGVVMNSDVQPANVPASQITAYNKLYAEVLGIVSQPQILYTRAGSDLSLQPLGSNMFDKSTIDTYSAYFSDTWHLKPSFTLSYGLSYTVETPPVEQDGKQIELVDSANNPINLKDYLATREAAALQGNIYNPAIGYSLVGNVGKGSKYPYNIFYGGWSPRASVAWNPKFDSGVLNKVFGSSNSVIRAGYGRIYGRLNGVDLVLVPLLGVGLGQAVTCIGATSTGVCTGPGGANPATAFRLGDPNPSALIGQGVTQTLPQPYFPGLNGAAKASDTLVLDPNFRPDHSDQFNLTIQRQLPHNMLFEIGYIGRRIRDEYMNINLDAIPWMLTLGGQSFAQAYAGIATEMLGGKPITSQPFFEAALAGSPYCNGFSSCTAAVAANEQSNIITQQVYTIWSDLGADPNNVNTKFYHSTIGSQQAHSVQMSGAYGYGNYNALTLSLIQRSWRGLTLQSNLTWSKSMGTASLAQANNGINPANPYDVSWEYGPQPYDLKLVYNFLALYQPPVFRSQQGFLGHVLGGWTIAPIWTWRTGYPLPVFTNDNGDCAGEAYGQGASDGCGNLGDESFLIAHYTGGTSRHIGVTGSNGVGVNGNMNMFSNPAQVYSEFAPAILGINTGGGAVLRGQHAWNVDLTLSKDIRFTERFGLSFVSQFTNIFNHPVFSDPYLDLADPADFGVIGPQSSTTGLPAQINNPRQIEFGLRFHF
jgi:Carboxypeptidase regulatory-like domain